MDKLTGRTRVRLGWLGLRIPEVEVVKWGELSWRKANAWDALALGDFQGAVVDDLHNVTARIPAPAERPDEPPPPPPPRSVRGDIRPPRGPLAPPIPPRER